MTLSVWGDCLYGSEEWQIKIKNSPSNWDRILQNIHRHTTNHSRRVEMGLQILEVSPSCCSSEMNTRRHTFASVSESDTVPHFTTTLSSSSFISSVSFFLLCVTSSSLTSSVLNCFICLNQYKRFSNMNVYHASKAHWSWEDLSISGFREARRGSVTGGSRYTESWRAFRASDGLELLTACRW